ncbi:hypothetical protein DS2_07203 [Catenovulum agarivorans DS-2]|uniref:Uncharacterized protein n=1 Tax=Catenovulum agarivorans DS-2 TaxID=1328313 RepID=W7QZ27_9ALTE|nr:hypothetical protein [Catenovulum agarivorans]EWH10600.1 hypothetical protein DS2_07203 [Catenovulum agarivorans DS-2]
MKLDEVPQDDSPTYSGHKKLLYAVDEKGHYHKVQSSGWDVESFATKLAVDDLNQQTLDAYQDAKAGLVSPLAYHMLKARLDITSLAQATGKFEWQIKRHLKPKIFAKLSDQKLQTYADIINISLEKLKSLPSQP